MAAKKTIATKSAPDAAKSIDHKRPDPVAPFKAHAHGVRATGTVSNVGETHRTSKHVRVTIRHTGPKKEGEYHEFDSGHETQVTMPAHLAKRFPHGKKVTMHVMPHGAKGAPPEDQADDAGESNESPIRAAFAKSAKKGSKK